MAIALLSAGAAISTSSPAAADAPTNRTPETAIGFTSVPYESGDSNWLDSPVATDPAAQLVAASCNGGGALYGTAWWKFTAPSASTFVVHAGSFTSLAGGYEPVASAVVSGDLAAVLGCGKEGTSISDAGAFTLQGSESAYIVTYLEAPIEPTIFGPSIGVYPSSGLVPANDAYASATPIASLPFSVTQDTTLATREPSEPACYSKFGVGPSVWFSVTRARTERLTVALTSDYGAEFVIVPPLAEGSTNWLCGESQFQADAGVTYRIGVYGTDELRNSGRLTLQVSAVPQAPAVQIKVDAAGTVNKKTGVVKLSGKVTCTGTSAANAVTGSLKQVYKRGIYQGTFTGTAPACTGKPVPWRANVYPTTFKYTKGKVTVTASVNACNAGGCTTANVSGRVKLKAS